jgi:hypothetical protein
MSDDQAAPPAEAPPGEGLEPTKLLRIGMMTQEMLGEARRAPLDAQARTRLREIFDKTLGELKRILPPELERELNDVTLPLSDDPSEPELRLAQAQLVGWLEGLFHGIQASLFAQQMQMQAQAQGYPRRLPGSTTDGNPGGQYL